MDRFVDLRREWDDALAGGRFDQLKWIVSQGITVESLHRARWFGAGTVLGGDEGANFAGTYLPGAAGLGNDVGCVLLGVWSRLRDVPATEDWQIRTFGPVELIDIVAIDVRNPTRWWMRLGGMVTGPVWLGQGPGFAVPDDDGVIDLHAAPFDWLRSGCRGKVLLNAGGYSALEIFHACKYVRTGGTGKAKEIYDDLRAGTRVKFPTILIREGKTDIAPNNEEVAA